MSVGSLGVKSTLSTLVQQLDANISLNLHFSPDDYHPPAYPLAIPVPAPGENSTASGGGSVRGSNRNVTAAAAAAAEAEARAQQQQSKLFRQNVAAVVYSTSNSSFSTGNATTTSATAAPELATNATLIVGNNTLADRANEYIYQPIKSISGQLLTTIDLQVRGFSSLYCRLLYCVYVLCVCCALAKDVRMSLCANAHIPSKSNILTPPLSPPARCSGLRSTPNQWT